MAKNLFKKNLSILIVFGLIISSFALAQGHGQIQGKKAGEQQKGEKIEEIMPNFEFIFPKEGERIQGEIVVRGKVKNATLVEFYYQVPGAIFAVYLGSAQLMGENLWEFEWNTNLTPNGNYEIFAKIINQYGEYESPRIKIEIKNEIPRDAKKEEERKKEVEKAEEEIKKEEEKMAEKKEETKEIISQGIENEEVKKDVQEKTEELLKKSKEVLHLEKEIEKAEKEKNEREKTEEKIINLKTKLKDLQEEKENLKKEIVEKAKPPAEKTASLLEDLEKKIEEKEEIKIEKSQILLQDSDGDGLSDQEEIRLGTNLFNPDSDGDGFLDGVEIKAGYNPLRAGPADKIIYQDPQKVLPKKADIYRVERIEKVVLANGEIGLKFSGKGLPNSFITLYIFSLPIVVVVKTDQNGHWEYTLDRPLADGEHRVYATLTNNHGEIEARSETFVFVKSGEKIFRIFEAPAEAISPVKALEKPFIILVLSIIILALAIALIIISVLTKRKIEKIKTS